MSLPETVLAIAASQVGVKEVGHSNSGQSVNAYLKATGLPPGYPWCQAFVYWCIQRACAQQRLDNRYIRTAGCAVVAAWADEQDILGGTPQRGDQFLMYGRPEGYWRACHTGLVTGVNGLYVETIEGNTNPGGSRDGYGVFRRTRPAASLRYVRYAAVLEPVALPPKKIFVKGQQVALTTPLAGASFAPVRAVAEACGAQVGWDYETQTVLLNGRPLATEITSLEGVAYANIHRLAAALGRKLGSVPGQPAAITLD